MTDKQKFLILRKKHDSEIYYERFSLPLKPGMTVLEALFYIQDNIDSTLAFRYSCRGAICGSCGMTINKYPRLACSTQVSQIQLSKLPKLPEIQFGEIKDWDKDNEILIEPLPNIKIIKDLIVDMDPFWNFYKEVKPHFIREWNDEKSESLQKPEEAKKVENLIYCILCGLCWTCPVSGKNKNYLGPAQLAKGYRFVADTRLSEDHRKTILEKVSQENGIKACERIFACNRVCPKNVKPGTAIKSLKEL